MDIGCNFNCMDTYDLNQLSLWRDSEGSVTQSVVEDTVL